MNMKSLLIVFCMILFLNAQDIKVKFMMGEVNYRASAQVMSWQSVQMGTHLQEKNIVRTGNKSMCELQLPDGSITKILENSMLELRNTAHLETHGIELFASLGKFYFKVKKIISGSFTVTSPVAVAAVRGTEFLTIHQGNETKILVGKGEVELSDPDKRNTVRIRSGYKASIQAGQMPGDPEPLTGDEMKAMEIIAKSTNSPDTEEEEIPDQTRKEEETTVLPVPSTNQNVTETEEDQPEEDSGSGAKTGFRMGAVIGAATIDDQIYSVIGLRPEFTIGKLGVALDLSIYMDKNGNIRKDNWDSARDIFEKLYYVRWGHQGDPFYAKVGAIDNYRLGFGLLMNHYFNTIEYPNVIRTGMELGLQGDKLGFQGMLNNFSELTDGGGLMAGRLSFKLIGNLEIGGSVVFDRNQYKGLKDRDKDGIPDVLDAFPDNKAYAIDTDRDGIPDFDDIDRDGNGLPDNLDPLLAAGYDSTDLIDKGYLADPALWESTVLDKPFDINEASDKSQIAFAGDISYPLINFDYLKLITYGQYAKYPHSGGWGVTAPGFLAKFAFINLYAEYRVFSAHFLPEYFNTTYELERAVFVLDSTQHLMPYTKRESLSRITENLKGYMAGADFNLFDYVIFGAEYQNMNRGTFRIRTFRSTLDLNTEFIPKISKAGAYYYQNNAEKLFKKTEGTILGYRVGYEIASGATLLLDYKQVYRDLNGDGKINGPNETVNITSIQTVISF